MPGILMPLWTGDSVWCKNCGRRVNRHQTGPVPYCKLEDMRQMIEKMQRTIK